jgi:hypothetical protein
VVHSSLAALWGVEIVVGVGLLLKESHSLGNYFPLFNHTKNHKSFLNGQGC